ncbi:uncharacterized protein LOC120741012 isoform X3 [Simochromis diagramma]|uniref:uncharacterized protein LOC120741012 isoform X3 n=1 Tax=Simochromis diagramma TaxID=43689 RepID=UPI001A7E42C1|nr:uncharacterized protein LOC120741012 isoform X3 [Simochromis diagramma]
MAAVYNYIANYFANKYHGLVNQGATCYLNSVLQVLFMTKDFREAVKRNPGRSQCIDHPLNTLFDNLKKNTTYTHDICSKLDVNPVSVQGDAAECFEKILSLTSPEASQIFQGVLTHRNKCSTCSTETGTDDPFWTLPLQLVESDIRDYNVADAVTKYFSQSDAIGLNQLYCDGCGCKSDATIKLEMRHHPDVLTLLLKRFKFDHRYQVYMKIRQAVMVPKTLQISENQTYELYAFVEHFGDLRSGHYTVTIKSQDDDRWYNFNDTYVRMLPEGPFQLDRSNTTRSSSAYLLFYRKKKMHAADTQHISEAPTGGASIYKQQEQVVKTSERDEVSVQGDAAECFEKILSLTSPEASQIFQGVLTHRNKCSTCSTETGTDDPFWTLPLQLVESDIRDYNVADAVARYFSQSDAGGVNKLYCDGCGCKNDAAIKLEMRHHPEVLTLLLKRFKFDYRYQEHVKIKRAVTVPDTLQIPENQTYELYAFVEHFGDLRSGHYTVTIKSQDDDRWYNFNDTCVTPLPEGPFQQERNKTALTRSSSAYLLFYRRKKMHAADTQHIGEAPIGGASTCEQKEQVVKTKGRDEDEAADMDHNLVDIQRNDQEMIMNDVENKDKSKQEKEKEKTGNRKNKDIKHVDNEGSGQTTKKRKTDNQESDEHKNDVQHQHEANLKPRKCSDHQDNQHSLKVEQNEKMRKYKLIDKDMKMMVDSESIDEANRSKTAAKNSRSVMHKDSNMFQSNGKLDEGKQNMSEYDESQKKNDKHGETDGEAAQRRDKTKRDFCESGKNKYSYLLADDSQSKEQHNQGQKVGDEGVERQTIENQHKLRVNQSHSRPTSVGEDMGGIGSEKEDQRINIHRSKNTQTQKTAEDVNDMLCKFKKLNLNEPPCFGKQFKNNSEANEHKQKHEGHEEAFIYSNISETKQEQQKEIIKYGLSRPNDSQIYAYYKTTLARYDHGISTSKQKGQRSPQVEFHSVEVIGHEELIKMELKRDCQQIPGDVDQQETGDHTGKQKHDEEVEREQTKEIPKPYCGESGKDEYSVPLDNVAQSRTQEDSEIIQSCGLRSFCWRQNSSNSSK